jgi:hypothetical protein
MNHNQNVFEFQVLEINIIPKDLRLLEWLDNESHKASFDRNYWIFEWLDNIALKTSFDVDYWIAITNQQILGNFFFDTIDIKQKPGKKRWAKSGKRLWVITSRYWERYFSPPSLFEYLALTIFRCALESLSRELQGELINREGLQKHSELITKGCIFDFTHHKPLRRILVSKPNLCHDCRKKLHCLRN